MRSYQVCLEISGDIAMWTRPDTGDCPVSYPAPTYSAVKGIFESILWGYAIKIIPFKVEICSPLIYFNYQTNYGGPLRKSELIKSGSSFQLLAKVLFKVCYRLYAEVVPVEKHLKTRISKPSSLWDERTTSPGHAYQSIFNRRLKRGQCFFTPFLGWKEFGANYFGPFRSETMVQTDIFYTLPSMLREVFSNGYASEVSFSYDQNLTINNGILEFPKKEVLNVK